MGTREFTTLLRAIVEAMEAPASDGLDRAMHARLILDLDRAKGDLAAAMEQIDTLAEQLRDADSLKDQLCITIDKLRDSLTASAARQMAPPSLTEREVVKEVVMPPAVCSCGYLILAPDAQVYRGRYGSEHRREKCRDPDVSKEEAATPLPEKQAGVVNGI